MVSTNQKIWKIISGEMMSRAFPLLSTSVNSTWRTLKMLSGEIMSVFYAAVGTDPTE